MGKTDPPRSVGWEKRTDLGYLYSDSTCTPELTSPFLPRANEKVK